MELGFGFGIVVAVVGNFITFWAVLTIIFVVVVGHTGADHWWWDLDASAGWVESVSVGSIFDLTGFTVGVNVAVFTTDFSGGGFGLDFVGAIGGFVAVGVGTVVVVAARKH